MYKLLNTSFISSTMNPTASVIEFEIQPQVIEEERPSVLLSVGFEHTKCYSSKWLLEVPVPAKLDICGPDGQCNPIRYRHVFQDSRADRYDEHVLGLGQCIKPLLIPDHHRYTRFLFAAVYAVGC
jgi:hypothetical protein